MLASYESNDDFSYIKKLGMDVWANEKSIIFEEIINERASQEIYDIFTKRFHGQITYDNRVTTESRYEKLFPLIENFYREYKDLIKEARITCNKNAIYKRIHKDKFEIFEELVVSLYDKEPEAIKKYIERAKALTKEMKKTYKKERVQEYIDKLRAEKRLISVLYKKDNEPLNIAAKTL